jgi:hypothetical protein
VKTPSSNMRETLTLPILFLTLFCVTLGCYDRSEFAGRHSPDDEILQPFAAMYEIDREQYCLTEIDPDSTVHVERRNDGDYSYDVMLHIEGDTSYRTVAFVWEDGEYVWISEQETHYSGRTYMTPDGKYDEHIVVSYSKRARVGMPEGLLITYEGPYEDIPARPTCEEALRVIRDWRERETPPDDD